MKIAKIILIVLVAIIAVPLVLALFVPKKYSVEREVVINQPRQVVYDYIKYLKHQDNFSSWAKMDPEMEKTYSGTDGQVGFVSAWESENPDVGVGEQEIIGMEEGSRVDYALRFKEPFEASDIAYFQLESLDAEKTKVIWGFEGYMAYPMNSMLLVMDMEGLIGNDFSDGLDRLKAILE